MWSVNHSKYFILYLDRFNTNDFIIIQLSKNFDNFNPFLLMYLGSIFKYYHFLFNLVIDVKVFVQ